MLLNVGGDGLKVLDINFKYDFIKKIFLYSCIKLENRK